MRLMASFFRAYRLQTTLMLLALLLSGVAVLRRTRALGDHARSGDRSRRVARHRVGVTGSKTYELGSIRSRVGVIRSMRNDANR